ncbi:glutaminase domain-containing protein [Streptomyces sp. NPDC087270]|uniref:glutaminase family protein n=1 Tax=Streptomyces sp. NPDC087270 TaxID=3365774 RepID=UPI0037F1AC7A
MTYRSNDVAPPVTGPPDGPPPVEAADAADADADTTVAAAGPGQGMSRRGLIRWTGAAGVVGLGAAGTGLLPGVAGSARAADTAAPSSSASTASFAAARSGASGKPGGTTAVDTVFDPIRPPAVPLAVRSPYLSAWLPASNTAGTWPTFWTGRTTAMTGIAQIDGVPYLFLGAPNIDGQVLRGMAQRSLTTTATRSVFQYEAAGVELTLTFLSPVEPGDLRRQSVPLSYLTAEARSGDGAAHDVKLYLDISGEWAHGDSGTKIGWSGEQVAGAGSGSLTSLSFTPDGTKSLAENGDMATWGTVVWSATNRPGLTWQIGADTVVRPGALTDGKLAGSADTRQPRAINDAWPVFAFHFDLGSVHRTAQQAVLSVGHVREPAVSYLGTPLPPLWKSYWPTWQQMAAFFHGDLATAATRTAALDRKVRQEATAAGGPKYAALCALALRQAYGGTELVSKDGKPWAMLKEISSSGNVSTVDLLYPAMPVFAWADPAYLGLLLAPVLEYAEHGGWPKEFAEHDLGSSYPNAAGHNDGNEEDMPVEESANMLLMSAAYLKGASASAGRAFATGHYPILKQWADYLVDNALDPGFQNQTDDFTGFIGHSANLALKGILGLGAMSQVAAAAGNAADRTRYLGVAKDYIGQWTGKAQDTTPDHLKLAYDQPGTWSLKYNGYPDALLGLGLVPSSVAAEEAAWYLTQVNPYGIPLDVRHAYTKGDWEMWTAAWLRDHPVSAYLIDSYYAFAHTTPSRVPFTDWYDTVNDRPAGGFQARPVIGGVFALLSVTR